MSDFTVIKRDHMGKYVLSYDGEILARGENWVCLQAIFKYKTTDLGYFKIEKGDLFTEWFYADRWYNVFRVQEGDSGALKGWYCNITRPAEIEETQLASDDLALDVLVMPNGEVYLLDEDEFAALSLSSTEENAVWDAVKALKALVKQHTGPFDMQI